ncbi:hypothetical protein AMTR_s00023p00248480 [Amborella trichopoda]|uniref:Uncharacterized protein n=1 Tax=Amborella trichopoda TaxID=13333 RepID=W1NJS5_AMBTC|nr:hypothetical protein AMTR_s00023p00248480 [Amborella trichopoda]
MGTGSYTGFILVDLSLIRTQLLRIRSLPDTNLILTSVGSKSFEPKPDPQGPEHESKPRCGSGRPAGLVARNPIAIPYSLSPWRIIL